jgi:hypothetical protein
MAVQDYMCGLDDAAEVDQGLIVDLILAEQFHVVSEIAQEPIELPKGALSAVEPPGERAVLKNLRFQQNESEV